MARVNHFVVSDLHFGHANVILYEPIRAELIAKKYGYNVETVLEMARNRSETVLQLHNQLLIDAWNSVVGPNDIVFFLGDFSLSRNVELIRGWASKLNGRKRMIMGNHDTRTEAFYMSCGFESVSKYPVLYNHHIFLSHQPLPREVVPAGYINFFGHVHSNDEFNWERGRCVCVEHLKDFVPIRIDNYIGDWHEAFPDRHNNR